ncbi:MAG: hypothetical protein M3155_03380 [Actinomycetota bacterium]|nr:hypothetical protein [Actinomycetota bacterium]
MALGAPVAALFAFGFAAGVLKLWNASLSIPFEYSANDANYQLMLVKGVLEHGWWFSNHNLGAPVGQELYDFAVGADNLQILVVKALGVVSSDPGVVANLFYLASFPLCALIAFWVLRWAGIGLQTAVVCSVLYAVLPYHFARGEHHAFLSAYYAVPGGCYLALAVAGGRPLFERRTRSGRLLRHASRRSLITLASCVAVASTGSVYYAAFTILLLAAAVGIRLATRPRPRSLVPGAVAIGLVAGVLAVNLAPTYLYALSHGHNHVAAHRQPAESELLGLKLGQLVLPGYRHRVDALADLGDRYATKSVPGGRLESYDAGLGFIGAAGLIWLLGIAVVRCVRPGRKRATGAPVDEAAALTLVALLVGTIGGISSLVSFLATAQLRAWNRISIFIAFFAFLAVGHLLDRLGRRLGPERTWRVGFNAALLGVLVLGVLDQTSAGFRPVYSVVSARYRDDARFVRAIERRLPRGAAVFQLPYIPFPEGGHVNGIREYDPLVGYLHSHHLRWSYGAMKGRKDPSRSISRLPVNRLLPALAVAGFDGLYVDRAGYPCGDTRQLESAVRRRVGAAPLVSRDRRLAFFDLRAYRAHAVVAERYAGSPTARTGASPHSCSRR